MEAVNGPQASATALAVSRPSPLVEVDRIERAGREAVRRVVAGKEVVAAALLVVLRLGAHVENLTPQGHVRGRRIVTAIEPLFRGKQTHHVQSSKRRINVFGFRASGVDKLSVRSIYDALVVLLQQLS